MQPNQEIKDPHPPANGETIADIPPAYCVHRRDETEHIARREENFDELLRVPRIDEPKINIHRAVHRTFVSGEQASGLARTVEHFVENVSAFLTAVLPAGPPPMIATSYILLLISAELSKLSNVW